MTKRAKNLRHGNLRDQKKLLGFGFGFSKLNRMTYGREGAGWLGGDAATMARYME